MSNSLVFNSKVYKNKSFREIVLKPKNSILILKDFDLFDIFIESKGGYSLIYIYILKLMETIP